MDLTGFLFGNVNEDGELEDESLLDKVSSLRAHQTYHCQYKNVCYLKSMACHSILYLMQGYL